MIGFTATGPWLTRPSLDGRRGSPHTGGSEVPAWSRSNVGMPLVYDADLAGFLRRRVKP